MSRIATLAFAYLVGAVPFSNLFAARLSGVDLRQVGSGTVSGTALYRVAGFKPLAVAGVLDVAKGGLVATLARRASRRAATPSADDPGGGPTPAKGWRAPTGTEAAAAGMVVVGHNWSPFLHGAGGRGVSPALGALAVVAPEGSLLLLAGLVAGRLTRQTGLGTFASQLALAPALAARRGPAGGLAGLAMVVPMLAKRLLGNAPPKPDAPARVYMARLLFDRDEWDEL
ncbi:MAG TPA: glycerol-3-phosphate acyltransferase [Acidimicrobiales bacterium]|nr:glycerol-3-phosphate acyltransferase [Acidimicrobiales bacterium]